MKRMMAAALTATLVFSAFAAPAQQVATSGNPKVSRQHSANSAGPSVSDQLKTMQDSIQAQQQQIQQLVQQLQRRDSEIQELQQQMNQVQSSAREAQQKADSATSISTQEQADVATVKSDVSDLKTNVTSTVLTLQETQKNVQSASESPLALRYKGVTVTPGGFLAAEFVRRSRALGADINTPFNSVPMPGASQSAMSEFFGSGRQSRISMLVEGKAASAKLSGYVETDFLSAGISANNNQSNSYSLRQRQAWGQVALDTGWSLTGGQMWSLVTETKHGMDNRTEAVPMTIDPQYTIGFSWARQYGLRLVKNFGNKVWFGVAVESAQATLSTHGNGANYLLGSAGNGGGLYNSGVTTCTTTFTNPLGVVGTTPITTCTLAASYSFNPSPDIISKIVVEPGFGHYEIFGVYSRFRDRVFPCEENFASTECGSLSGPSAILAYNASQDGGGIGANARWSLANKRLDFGLHAFGGEGIGRYGTGGLADTAVYGDGTLNLIRNYQGLATLEWHGPKLDIYLNTGAEYNARAASFDPILNVPVGYGSTSFNNSGCGTETVPVNGTGFLPGSLGKCTADTRVLIEGTAGFWYRVYNGTRGRIQWGPQFSYVDRQSWSGANGLQPHGIDGMIFTSFRYYLP